MFFRQIFEPRLAQYSYLIGSEETGEAIVIDPMRDIMQYIDIAEREKLRIVAAAETHIHADYVSGLREFAAQGIKVYASDEGDRNWKYEWLIKNSYAYRLLKDGDVLFIGRIEIRAIHTPGHTPEHLMFAVVDGGSGATEPMGYITGDFIFVGDVGRPDLLESAAGYRDTMKPSAQRLYTSVLSFKRLPEYHRIWPGHGAGSACGKSLGSVPDSTVGYELRYNMALSLTESEEQFVNYILNDQPEPPLYFSRMKQLNKLGPDILGSLPQPLRLDPYELRQFIRNTDVTLIDTRNRRRFLDGHIPGSLLSPLDRQFNTTAGCYADADKPVYLIVQDENLETAVRDLVNVGLDQILGYATPEDLDLYRESGGELAQVGRTTFQDIAVMSSPDSITPVDVRRYSEFAAGRVKNAINRPHTRILENMVKLPPNESLAIYCSSGRRSAIAAALLKRYNFQVLYVEENVSIASKIAEIWDSQAIP